MSYLFDTFSNFLSGLGVPGRDKMTAFRYTKPLWARDQLEASFSSDWIARKAIVIPAEDSTREWRAWQAEADQIEKLEETEARLGVQLKLQTALVKARLYGGACILIGVDGDMSKELDPLKIKKDALKFIHVLSPHQLQIEELEKDITSPYYGQPKFYRLVDENNTYGTIDIHPSRMVRLIGLEPPDPMDNNGWGDPMLQVINDAVASAGTVSQSIAALIAEAKFDVVKIPGLTEILSTTNGTTRLIKRFSEANVAKSVINAIVLDAEEEWERIGVDFNGMPEILQMYLQIASGAADIPATRFLGRSPAGLNATGDSDLQNYYDRIASDQDLRLTPALEKLDLSIIQSALGKQDKDVWYEWRSLWQMTDAEKAEIAHKKATTAKVDADTGLVPFEALVQGRCNQLIEDASYPGLEAAIEDAIAAEEMMPEEERFGIPANENMEAGMEPMAGPAAAGDSEGRGEGFDDRVIPFGDRLVPWDESLHPRDPSGEAGGQFVSKGGAASGASSARDPVAALRAIRSSSFVSPNVKSDLDFKGAIKELASRQQLKLLGASADIHKKLSIQALDTSIIGAWSDGAENSVMTRYDADWEQTLLAGVMKAHLADQKAVLVFQSMQGGKTALAMFTAKGDLDSIHKNLLEDGIENHTMVPTKDGATVYVVDLDGSTLEAIDKGAQRYGENNEVLVQFGRGEFVGTTKEDGTDREQRDSARQVYESYIGKSKVQNAGAIWQDINNRWGSAQGKVGFRLTSNAIIEEAGDIKPNSVAVVDLAKDLNERAGEILQEELGVDFVDQDTHTPETDDYLANVVAQELKDGLHNGRSGEDWYDKTMIEAMQIAEKIYPGVGTDPAKKFLYTVALAVTSQGEVVESNVRLADLAYLHYDEHGVFPTNLDVADPNINQFPQGERINQGHRHREDA